MVVMNLIVLRHRFTSGMQSQLLQSRGSQQIKVFQPFHYSIPIFAQHPIEFDLADVRTTIFLIVRIATKLHFKFLLDLYLRGSRLRLMCTGTHNVERKIQLQHIHPWLPQQAQVARFDVFLHQVAHDRF
jgi:hypothetical protein